METLFLVMTSIGRDMEGTFPSKMKLLLAAVRDALLGLGPYFSPTCVLSPLAQKTLMQLIELHAANWHLPASAVRYYYSADAAKNHDQEFSTETTAKTENNVNNHLIEHVLSFNGTRPNGNINDANNNKRRNHK